VTTPDALNDRLAATPAPAKSAQAEIIGELQEVNKSFAAAGGQNVAALCDINLQIRSGEFVAILGQSGSGKSTIVRILAGLMAPSTGRVLMHGQPLQGINESLAIVFQTFALYPWLTVADNVRVGLTRRRVSKTEEDAEIEKAVGLIGLGGYENAYPKELSGGMRQRVGFARALVAQPEILCMDEPFSALDVFTAENMRREVLALWHGKKAGSKSIILITHNIEEAVFLADRIVVMGTHPGCIREILTNEVPVPRDPRSASFQRMVRRLHDVIVCAHLPETERVPSEPARPESATPQPVPHVGVGEIFGLLIVLAEKGGEMDVFALDEITDHDFGHTLAVVKAAEMLDFLETPQNQVVLTNLGREVAIHIGDRKRVFRERIRTLPTFRFVQRILEKAPRNSLPGDVVLEELVMRLPLADAELLFETVVEWSRYAELFGYSDDTGELFIDSGSAG